MTKGKKKNKDGLIPTHSRTTAKAFADTEEHSLLGMVFKASLLGLLTATVCGIALITLMSAIAYADPDPARLIAPLAIAALMPSAFAGGFLTAKKVKDAPLLCGIVSGGFITLLTMLLSAIFQGLPSSNYEFWQSAALHGASILFSVMGAFAGNAKKKKKPSKRRFG